MEPYWSSIVDQDLTRLADPAEFLKPTIYSVLRTQVLAAWGLFP